MWLNSSNYLFSLVVLIRQSGYFEIAQALFLTAVPWLCHCVFPCANGEHLRDFSITCKTPLINKSYTFGVKYGRRFDFIDWLWWLMVLDPLTTWCLVRTVFDVMPCANIFACLSLVVCDKNDQRFKNFFAGFWSIAGCGSIFILLGSFQRVLLS